MLGDAVSQRPPAKAGGMRLRPAQTKVREAWGPSLKASFNKLAYGLTTDLTREAKADRLKPVVLTL